MREVRVLVEETSPIDVQSIHDTLLQQGINSSFFGFRFNHNEVMASDIYEQLRGLGKFIIVTNRRLVGDRILGLSFHYYGYADAINGDVAIISECQKTSGMMDKICLHETLHLFGLKHCSSQNCVMGVKLGNYELVKVGSTLCDNCRDGLDGTKEN